jgi:UDP-N-acetylmuramoylalanine--D-glutamate ligase
MSEARAVLLAGGRDKHGSYQPLAEALRERGRAVVVIGEAAARIAAAVEGALPVEHAGSMEDAVRRAFRLAQPGDAVLLSPACSSFDMFEGYADRGEHFERGVHDLAARVMS